MKHATDLKEKAGQSHGVGLTKILVTTDFSEESNRALEYALYVARQYDARILLTHVITPDPFLFTKPSLAKANYEEVRRAAEQRIADILVSGKLRGVPHEVLLEYGSVWPVLKKLIKKNEIDLVVSGTHGCGKVQELLIGSVTEKIFWEANCAVLTVGPLRIGEAPTELELKNILFATDFEPDTEKAAAHAFSLAQKYAARLTTLHVAEVTVAFTEGSLERRQLTVQRLATLMPADIKNRCKPEFRARFGEAAEEILTMARETKADLIVMDAKSWTSLDARPPLTIAYNVVTKALCPVLTVRG
jgi:nucleotide-binding universal stress UspA family protein